MNKEQLDIIKSILSVLDFCVLKESTSIPSCVSLVNKLQSFARVVKELEEGFINESQPQAEKLKRSRKSNEEKPEAVSA